ncbi:MAG: recombinase family protein [Pseudomonadota bacterium]
MAEGVKIGYARSSSHGPTLDDQRRSLREAGVSAWNIFADEAIGSAAERSKLMEARQFVQRDDTIVITSLDRVARSLNELHEFMQDLAAAGVALVVLEQGIDTSAEEPMAMLDSLAEFARFDADLRKESKMDGIRLAQARGVKVGRKRSVDRDAVIAAYRTHRTIGATAKAVGTSKPTVHRILKAAGIDTSGRAEPG